MSSLKVISPTIDPAARDAPAESRASEDFPADGLAELLRASTKRSTETASCAFLRNWMGAAQADFFWLPLDADALSSAPASALIGLARSAVARGELVTEPGAPDETHPVWVGVAVPLRCEGRAVAVLACSPLPIASMPSMSPAIWNPVT